MAESTHKTWWKLHIRAVRNESLNAEERAAYETGLKQLHQEETLNGDVATLRKARAEVKALEAENTQLQVQRNKLAAEIAVLEAALSRRTGHLLDAEA